MDRLCFDPPFKTSKSFEEWVKQQYDYGKMHQGLQMNPYVGMALAFGLVKIYLQEKNRGDYARVTSGINSNGSKQQLPKLKEIELKHILMRFEYFKHNKTKTAKSLGIHVDTLRSKLKAISDIAVKSDTE
jgi:DNA-binding protein Fis